MKHRLKALFAFSLSLLNLSQKWLKQVKVEGQESS